MSGGTAGLDNGRGEVSHVDFSTLFLKSELKSDVWRRLMAPLFDVFPLGAGDGRLEGHLSLHGSGTSLAGISSFNAQRFMRDQRLVLASGLDQYVIQLLLAGQIKSECAGETVEANVGDIIVLDLGKTMTGIVSRDASTVTLIVSRVNLDRATDGQSLHGKVIRSSESFAGPLRALLLGVHRHGPFAMANEAGVVEDTAVFVLSSLLSRNAEGNASSASTLSTQLRQRILEYVGSRLRDPGMTPDHLMKQFGVSRAHMYRMFAVDGGVAAMIRDQRLNSAYLDLAAANGLSARSITEVAHEYWFSSSNHFLRAFRARFACAPSEIRHMEPSAQIENSANGILLHFVQIASTFGATPAAASHRGPDTSPSPESH
jgi:AraC-like DNA-binding protein